MNLISVARCKLNLNTFGHILRPESKVMCHYIDLNFPACKIKEFTLKSLKEMLKSLVLSQIVTKRKPTEAYRNGNRSCKPHYSIEALTSPNATKAFATKKFL